MVLGEKEEEEEHIQGNCFDDIVQVFILRAPICSIFHKRYDGVGSTCVVVSKLCSLLYILESKGEKATAGPILC